MNTIDHRELRDNSNEVLRRVEAGEQLIITRNGKPIALMSPYPRNGLEEARSRGEVREALIPPAEGIRQLTPISSDISSEKLLRDVRGEW